MPFRFPSGPDTGPGLTGAGKRLVAECNRLRILIDLSHLNEAGFWDVARHSGKPLVATHSGAHAVTASTRNLTDRQLDAIAASGGLVGLNFGCQFLRLDGLKNPATTAEDMLRHLDHLLSRLGEGGVALGSDFDGATIPKGITDVAGLPALQQAMLDHGYGEALVRKISSKEIGRGRPFPLVLTNACCREISIELRVHAAARDRTPPAAVNGCSRTANWMC
mgnify:CR=1 FL=1